MKGRGPRSRNDTKEDEGQSPNKGPKAMMIRGPFVHIHPPMKPKGQSPQDKIKILRRAEGRASCLGASLADVGTLQGRPRRSSGARIIKIKVGPRLRSCDVQSFMVK